MRATTTCPHCGTTFRIKHDQLEARQGQVRCGKCRRVFNGLATVSLGRDSETGRDAEQAADNPARAPADDAARRVGGAMAGAVAKPTGPVDQSAKVAALAGLLGGSRASAAATPAEQPESSPNSGPEAPVLLPLDLGAPQSTAALVWRWARFALPVPLVLLVLLVLLREPAIHRFPGLAGPIGGVCNVFGCSMPLGRDADRLSIEASELRAEPDRPGVIVVQATLRNRAAFAQDYPNLELTLTDGQDKPLSKTVIPPAQYLERGTDLAAGMAPNADASVRMEVSGDNGRAAGYRLYLFFP